MIVLLKPRYAQTRLKKGSLDRAFGVSAALKNAELPNAKARFVLRRGRATRLELRRVKVMLLAGAPGHDERPPINVHYDTAMIANVGGPLPSAVSSRRVPVKKIWRIPHIEAIASVYLGSKPSPKLNIAPAYITWG